MNRVFIIMMAIALLSGIVNAAVEIQGGEIGLALIGAGISMDFENLYLSIGGSYFPRAGYCLNLGMGTQTEGRNMGPIVLKGKIGMNLNGVYEGVGSHVESVVFSWLIFGFEGTVEYLVRCFDFMYIGIWIGGISPVFAINIQERRLNQHFFPCLPFYMSWPQGGLVIRFGN